MREGACWAVTAEFALGEEFELLVVGVTGDGACRADSSLLATGMAQIDSLAYVSKGVSAL